jgi:hypothetical protein
VKGCLPRNDDGHRDVKWEAHITNSEDPLILKDDRDFDEHEASVCNNSRSANVSHAFHAPPLTVCDDAPKKRLSDVSCCVYNRQEQYIPSVQVRRREGKQRKSHACRDLHVSLLPVRIAAESIQEDSRINWQAPVAKVRTWDKYVSVSGTHHVHMCNDIPLLR